MFEQDPSFPELKPGDVDGIRCVVIAPDPFAYRKQPDSGGKMPMHTFSGLMIINPFSGEMEVYTVPDYDDEMIPPVVRLLPGKKIIECNMRIVQED